MINDAGMSDTTPPPKTEPGAHASEASPKDELSAALAHLKSAADLIAKRIDPAVRKAAGEAERAIERVASETERTATEIGAAALPPAKAFASRVGSELGRLADEIKKSVAQLEHAVDPPKGAAEPDATKTTPDPDDPGALR